MKSTYPQVRYGVFPMVKDKTGGNLGVHRLLLDGEGREEQGGRLDAAQLADGPVGQKLWISKGLALPSRTDVKAIGGRKAFLSRGAVRCTVGASPTSRTPTPS